MLCDVSFKNKGLRGLFALSPLFVFLGLYVVISLVIGDFYKVPISVALLAASCWALVVYRGVKLSERIESFAREAGSANIIYMIWIFILAGAFASLAGNIGAVEATVALTMGQLPSWLVLPGLFAAACFISLAIGTSVGTVVALTPLAVSYAESSGANTAFFVAVVLGGAFFGDNLSFISDTTIAATRTQECKMNDKFKANFAIVFPAALITLAIYVAGDFPAYTIETEGDINHRLVIPYLAVIVLALCGVNVTVTLLSGIALAILLGLWTGNDIFGIFGYIGEGIEGMGSLIVITILAAGLLGLIKAAGGIDFLLNVLTHGIKGARGAQWAIAMLVGIVNLCTANNTVAILTVGSISKDISSQHGITPRRSASLLDTASCIVQCLIPYGAQTLLATSIAHISPTDPWRYLYYPWILLGMVTISIVYRRKG